MGVMPFYGGLIVIFIFHSPPVFFMQQGGGRFNATAALDPMTLPPYSKIKILQIISEKIKFLKIFFNYDYICHVYYVIISL